MQVHWTKHRNKQNYWYLHNNKLNWILKRRRVLDGPAGKRMVSRIGSIGNSLHKTNGKEMFELMTWGYTNMCYRLSRKCFKAKKQPVAILRTRDSHKIFEMSSLVSGNSNYNNFKTSAHYLCTFSTQIWLICLEFDSIIFSTVVCFCERSPYVDLSYKNSRSQTCTKPQAFRLITRYEVVSLK